MSRTESRNAAPGFRKTTRPGLPSQRLRSRASQLSLQGTVVVERRRDLEEPGSTKVAAPQATWPRPGRRGTRQGRDSGEDALSVRSKERLPRHTGGEGALRDRRTATHGRGWGPPLASLDEQAAWPPRSERPAAGERRGRRGRSGPQRENGLAAAARSGPQRESGLAATAGRAGGATGERFFQKTYQLAVSGFWNMTPT